MVLAGVTVISAVVTPVLQEYVPPPIAVSVAEAPAHIVPSLLVVPDVSVTLMEVVGKGFTVIVTEAAEEQLPTVTVTV